jgi:hypothetical protein
MYPEFINDKLQIICLMPSRRSNLLVLDLLDITLGSARPEINACGQVAAFCLG